MTALLAYVERFGSQALTLAERMATQYPVGVVGGIAVAGFALLVVMMTRNTLRWKYYPGR